jgi:hypothetical protein
MALSKIRLKSMATLGVRLGAVATLPADLKIISDGNMRSGRVATERDVENTETEDVKNGLYSLVWD